MKMKFSYMKRYFIKIMLLTLVLVGVLVLLITMYSRTVVSRELVSLHQSILNQSVRQPAQVISALKASAKTIAENSGLIDWLDTEMEVSGSVDAFISDEINSNYELSGTYRVYIYDELGLRYASDYPEISRGVLEQVLHETEEEADGFRLYGPVNDEEQTGLYRYSCYLVYSIRDLLSDRQTGYVLLQFSEPAMYNSFQNLSESGREYCIVDESGRIYSAREKTSVGEMYIGAEREADFSFSEGAGCSIDRSADMISFYEKIPGTNLYLLESMDLKAVLEPVNRIVLVSGILILLFILCFLPMTFFSFRTIVRPIDAIKNKMSAVAKGNLQVRIPEADQGRGELAEIAESFNVMAEKLEDQVEEIQSIERKKHRLQLDFLQTQINPHFIYNTLSSIRFYVEMGRNEDAEKMLIDFSKLLRKTLSSSEKMITLREEKETLEYYIDLQKARYRERFVIEMDMPEETLSCIVPDFITQPIVENAIFYSLKEKEICHILIRSRIIEDVLYISVKDNGIGMDQDRINEVLDKSLSMNKVGIRNVNERLKLNYGEQFGLQILSQKNVGTEVVICIPVTESGDKNDENTDS